MRRPSWVYRVLVVAGLVLGLALPAQAITMADSRLGGLAYYDSDLDITWAANANLAQTSGFDADGLMNWSDANTWAMNVTIGGVSGWRLPTTTQPDATCSIQSGGNGFGTGCTGSEMGHLFNVEGISAAAPGVFSNVQANFYWSGTEFAPKIPSARGTSSSVTVSRARAARASTTSSPGPCIPGMCPPPRRFLNPRRCCSWVAAS